MRVHSFESFGAADGPGVRFVVFLKGCPFRCLYCHNPDTWASPGGEEHSAAEVLARALRYRGYWGGEGGITVSGGEPMLQAAEVAELFELAHAKGVNTCLDTAGGPFTREGAAFAACERLLAATDTVLLDLKHLDPEAHRRLTGADNAPVLELARYLAERGRKVWIRHVLVPGVTDAPGHLERLAGFIRTLPNVEKVEVLPYHTMGVAKWRALGLEYALEGVNPPTAEQIAAARKVLLCG